MLSTSLRVVLPLWILVVIILSSVSQELMAFSQCEMISSGVWDLLLITWSHLSTQIRCANSEIRNCSSLSCPFLSYFLCWLSSSLSLLCSSPSGRDRLPQLRIRPSLMFGQSSDAWGHASHARVQIVLTVSVLQVIKIWFMSSIVWKL